MELELVIELVPQVPLAVVDAVTVKAVVPPGVVVPFVEIVRVDVVEEFETVVGLNDAVAPVGSVPLNTSAFDVQASLPAQVVVIE